MTKVAIIGQSSYLSQGLEDRLTGCHITRLSRHTWRDHADTLQKANYIINFCVQPETFAAILPPEALMDIQLATLIESTAARLVFLSSRKVYGTTDICQHFRETDELKPFDFYSCNKVQAERILTEKLKERVAILRVANVIGPPLYNADNRTFVAWISQQIKDQCRIALSVDKHTVKDFVTRDYFQDVLGAFLHTWASGVWNVASGEGVSLGELLDAMVGENQYDDLPGDLKDQFILDASKLEAKTGLFQTKEEVLEACHASFAPLFSAQNAKKLIAIGA